MNIMTKDTEINALTQINDKNIIKIKTKVYVFGDSHADIFLGAESPNFKADVAGLDGASILGLNKKISYLEYGKHVMFLINRSPKSCHLLLKLGQVDLEFVMYYKIYVKKENFLFKEFCEELIDKYREFINRILKINTNVIIAAINLPSYDGDYIKDYIKRTITENVVTDDIVANKVFDMNIKDNMDLSLCFFTLEQLTKNFQYFNELLHNLANEMNLRFFDTTEVFIDKNTNLLKNEYRCYGHHYKGWSDEKHSNAKKITCNYFCSFFN